MKKIEKDTLLNIINNLIQANATKSDEFKAGMMLVKENIKNYFKNPPYVMNKGLEAFALEYFLNNDISKLTVFSNLIELFELKMKNLAREETWNSLREPEYMDWKVKNMLTTCFDGVTFKKISENFDRGGGIIDLTIRATTPDNKTIDVCVSEYGMEDDDDENHDEITDFYDFLNVQIHYEALLLFVCLKKMFNYVNPQKIEDLLIQEREIDN